jgi:hypothetical protein
LAGRHALGHAAASADETRLLKAAVEYLGLSALAPFEPASKVLELMLER